MARAYRLHLHGRPWRLRVLIAALTLGMGAWASPGRAQVKPDKVKTSSLTDASFYGPFSVGLGYGQNSVPGASAGGILVWGNASFRVARQAFLGAEFDSWEHCASCNDGTALVNGVLTYFPVAGSGFFMKLGGGLAAASATQTFGGGAEVALGVEVAKYGLLTLSYWHGSTAASGAWDTIGLTIGSSF